MTPLGLAAGAFILAVGLAAGVKVGLALADRLALQHRVLNKELRQDAVNRRRQLVAARDAVGRIVTDPRTAPHDRLALEEHVAPLLVERDRGG